MVSLVQRDDDFMENYVRLFLTQEEFIIEPIGELDASNSDLLSEAFWLHSLFAEHPVTLSMGQLNFMASAAIGVVVGHLRDVTDRHGKLTVAGMQGQIRDTFDMLGLDRFLHITDRAEYAPPVMAGIIAAGSITILAPVRHFVKEFLEHHHLPELEVARIVLMVDELCSNISRHAQGLADLTESIVITVQWLKEESQVVIRIMDRATSFDVTQYQGKDIEELIESRIKGGLGLRLVSMLADEIRYFQLGGRNVCQLVRKVALAQMV